jgi:hypothetical protein
MQTEKNNEIARVPFATRNWPKNDNKSYFSKRKILETPVFLELFTERRFHLLLKFSHFVDNENYEEATCSSRRLYKQKSVLDSLNDRFRNVYALECEA